MAASTRRRGPARSLAGSRPAAVAARSARRGGRAGSSTRSRPWRWAGVWRAGAATPGRVRCWRSTWRPGGCSPGCRGRGRAPTPSSWPSSRSPSWCGRRLRSHWPSRRSTARGCWPGRCRTTSRRCSRPPVRRSSPPAAQTWSCRAAAPMRRCPASTWPPRSTCSASGSTPTRSRSSPGAAGTGPPCWPGCERCVAPSRWVAPTRTTARTAGAPKVRRRPSWAPAPRWRTSTIRWEQARRNASGRHRCRWADDRPPRPVGRPPAPPAAAAGRLTRRDRSGRSAPTGL